MGIRFGQRLRRARNQEGLTQAGLAERLGVSQALVALWESGKGNTDKHIKAIEKAVGKITPLRKPTGQAEVGAADLDVEVEPGPSDFGIWLKAERKKRGISVSRLSELSKLSSPAIYNIENGKIQNPQDKTKKNLAAAIDASIPAGIGAATDAKDDDPSVGNLTDFAPHSVADWPNCPGIYVFYDISERPVYVGQGSKISDRIRNHEQKFWYRRPIVEYASFVEIKDKNLRRQIEKTMIKFMKSNAVINKQDIEAFDV